MKTRSGLPAMLRRICSVLLLIAAVALSVKTTVTVSALLLDSDAAANLILGEKIAREGGILSSTWVYSTELNVLDTQLIYALLFRLTSSWFAVRVAGALIMQALLLAAYGYLAYEAKMSFNAFCVTGAVLLLPFSVAYGRIVLYHNYYMPHVTLDFLMVGLFLSLCRKDHRRSGILWTALRALALCALAFCTGLSSVRQLMICGAPLLASAVLAALLGEHGREKGTDARLKQALPMLLWAGVLVVCCLAGYLVNSHVLVNTYTVQSYNEETLSMTNAEGLVSILKGLLLALGVQDGSDLFTAQGMISVGMVLALLLTVIIALHTARHTRDEAARVLSLMGVMTLLVMTCVFAFLAEGEWLYELYYVPVIVWMLPALGKAELRPVEDRETMKGSLPERMLGKGTRPMTVHGLAALAVCLIMAASGVFYAGFFNDPSGRVSDIPYSGLNYNDVDTVSFLKPVAEYLKDQGFTLCYASYWDAGVITELSDGQVRASSVEPGSRRKPIKYYNWLTDLNNHDSAWVEKQKVALLANFDLMTALEDMEEVSSVAKELESFGGYTVYELTDPAVLARALE